MKIAHISNFLIPNPLFTHLNLNELYLCRVKKNSSLWRSIWKATDSSAEQEEKIFCELPFQTLYCFYAVQNLLLSPPRLSYFFQANAVNFSFMYGMDMDHSSKSLRKEEESLNNSNNDNNKEGFVIFKT